jgi:uncharacterized protein YggE
MNPDTITVRVVTEAELDADSADLKIVVEGSSVFSGSEAFKKAKKLRDLIESLKEVGIDEQRIKLRSVQINSRSFALIKSSSAKYTISVKTVKLEVLPAILGAIATHKGAWMTELRWNYSKLGATRRELRLQALRDAQAQARLDAEVLGVQLLGVCRVEEVARERDYKSEYVTADYSGMQIARARAESQDLAGSLGNSTTVTLELKAEFRVGAAG